jgi:predicted phage terminase large subunit-like protein
MVERAEDLASFLSERQNDPFDPAGSYFPEEALEFLEPDEMPSLDQVRLSVGFWDPSRGTSKSDTSATFRLDVLHDARRVVSEGLAGRVPPEEVIETIVGFHKRRAFLAFGVEKVGLSNYDGDLQRIARESGVSLPVQPVTPQGEKTLRIKSLRPLVVSKGLLFSAKLPLEAIQQIKYFGQHPNDDVPDAIQQANQLADLFLQDVQAAGGVVEPEAGTGRIERESIFGEPDVALPQLEDRMGILEQAWI